MKKSVEKLQLRVTLQGLEDAAMDEQGYKTITLDMESILFIFYNTYKKKLYKTNNKYITIFKNFISQLCDRTLYLCFYIHKWDTQI